MNSELKQTCAIKKCLRAPRGQGYCKNHYHRYVFIPKRPLYYIYQNMIRRCHYIDHPRYSDWGGRGIKVCEAWRNDYFAFANDIGPRPSPFHQIDRIDNDGDYEPSNCRWVLPIANNGVGRRRTKSNNKSGKTGVCYSIRAEKWQATITINKHRYHLGWFSDIKEAITARELAEIYYANTSSL